MSDDGDCNDSKCEYVRKGITHKISEHSELGSTNQNPIKKISIGIMIICLITGMILVAHTPQVDHNSSLYIYAGGILFAIAAGMCFLLKKLRWV